MKEDKIKKGAYVTIYKDGKLKHIQKADKALRIEYADNLVVTEKALKDLNVKEKDKEAKGKVGKLKK